MRVKLSAEEVKLLLRNGTFKKFLERLQDIIALNDTVMSIDPNNSIEGIGLHQLSTRNAIIIIQDWLRDILGEIEFDKYKNNNIPEDSIFNMIDEESQF